MSCNQKEKKMKTPKTEFGLWLAHFMLNNNTNMAEVAQKLRVSPSLLSHISTGRRAIPKNFHYAFITEFGLDAKDRQELEKAIDLTEEHGQLHLKSPYIVCRALNDQDWTKEIMQLFGMCVNKLTQEEAMYYKKQFQKISERPNKD